VRRKSALVEDLRMGVGKSQNLPKLHFDIGRIHGGGKQPAALAWLLEMKRNV
jgi:hypothetical protein